MGTPTSAGRLGRPTTVRKNEVAAVGLELFLRDGFDETTMTDVARAAGIARKTLFLYFPTKAAIVWNRFRSQLDDLVAGLEAADPALPTTDAISQAVLGALHMGPEEVGTMRAEVSLIERTPSLQAYAYMEGAPWRDAIAQFVSRREELPLDGVLPQATAHGFWQVMFVAFRHWLASKHDSPVGYVTDSLHEFSDALRGGFGHHDRSGQRR